MYYSGSIVYGVTHIPAADITYFHTFKGRKHVMT